MDETAQDRSATPRKRGRFVRVSLLVLAALVLAAAGGALWLTDRPLAVPDWARAQIEDRLETHTGGIGISVGEMELTVYHGWRPALRVRDVTIRDDRGRQVLAVAGMDARLAMRPLLRGDIQPKSLSLSGIFATLHRAPDGTLSLFAVPDGEDALGAAPNLAELVAQIDAVFLRPDFKALTLLELASITLRFEDARAGRVWTVDGAKFAAMRTRQDLRLTADLAILGGGAGAATIAASYESTLGEKAAVFGITVEDLPAQDLAAVNPTFGWLEGLRAPMSASLRGAVLPDGDLDRISAALQIGAGVLQPTRTTRPVPFDAASAYLTIDPARDVLDFDGLSLVSPWITGEAVGSARLTGVQTGRLEELIGQLRVTNLTINPPGLYEQPLQLARADIDLRLIPDPFRLDLGRMYVKDGETLMRAEGWLEAAPDGWRMAVDGRASTIASDRVLAVWPEEALPKTRAWLGDNLAAGALSNLQFALRSKPGARPDTYLSFDFDEAEVRYMRTFPPVMGAQGTASLLRDRFVLSLVEGRIAAPQGGEIDVAGSSFIVPDVTVRGGSPAVVRLRTAATIPDTLSLLDLPPLNLMEKAGRPVTLARGWAEAETVLSMPMARGLGPEAIDFRVTGTLHDVESDVIVPGRRIAADVLDLTADNSVLQIGGAGTLDGIAARATWTQPLGPAAEAGSRVEGSVDLSAEAAETLGLGLPSDLISGRTKGALALTLPRGAPPRFTLESGLAGLGLRIPSLGWRLPEPATGTLRVAGTLGPIPQVDVLDLDLPGLRATGRIRVSEAGGLEAAQFDRVQLGGWLDAPVTLRGRGAGRAPEVVVRGGFLDLRNAEFGGAGSQGGRAGGPLDLTLDQLQITDTMALTDMTGRFTLAGGLSGSFEGRVNGQAAVTGDVAPEAGRSAVRIASGDAGAVFSAAGLLKQARGGEMTLTLRPVGTAGAFNGALSVRDTRITDAPAIAALFNALSIVGLIEQMGGSGLHFAQVEAAFRLTPDRVTLTQASATGPSIGLSMDGTYDLASAQMDMQGVFSPLYLINGVGSVLTRPGEGLIGFNFALRGPASAPQVQVNPFSALTPSIFREIFRRPPPEIALEPGEAGGLTPRIEPALRPEDPPAPVVRRGPDR